MRDDFYPKVWGIILFMIGLLNIWAFYVPNIGRFWFGDQWYTDMQDASRRRRKILGATMASVSFILFGIYINFRRDTLSIIPEIIFTLTMASFITAVFLINT